MYYFHENACGFSTYDVHQPSLPHYIMQTLTSSFRAHDTNQNGWIQISYEQFLTLVFSLKA